MRPAPGAHRPPHPLGPGVVQAVPAVPHAAGGAARRPAPPLEGDGSFAHFQLDGQLAVVDDYLEIRPGAGRAGSRRSTRPAGSRWGPGTRCPTSSWCRARPTSATCGSACATAERVRRRRWRSGYLPDMFGHVAQMPQILAGFGLADAVVWRGVPVGDRRPGVLVGGARRHPGAGRVPDRRLRQRRPHARARQGAASSRSTPSARRRATRSATPILWMNGTDHLLPQAHLGPGGGRGQRGRRRLRAGGHLAGRPHRRGAPRRPAHLEGRAALRAPAPTC